MSTPLGDVRRELMHAARVLRRSPAFAVTAILVLGLAIGITTAAFCVFDAVVRRPLPIRDQGEVVLLWAENGALAEGQREVPFRYAQFQRFRASTRTLREVAAAVNFGTIPQAMVVGDQVLSLSCALVSGDFFQVLGTSPVLGRLLRAEDDLVGAPPVMVISFATWRQVFGGRDDVLGMQVRNIADGAVYSVVGVAPPGLGYPAGADYWIPMVPATTPPGGDSFANVYAVGRMAAGTQVAAARDELAAFVRAEAAGGVDSLGSGARAIAVHPVAEVVAGTARPALLAVSIGGALLLLIACASIGSLLLVRGAGRRREIAVRRALGASYAQVVRQLLLENAILVLLGGVIGLLLADALLQRLLAVAPPGLPQLDVLGNAGAPLLMSFAVSTFTLLLFGVGPALDSARVDLAVPLRAGAGAGRESQGRRRAKQVLVAGQVAFAVVILAAAGVLGRSLARLQALELGFRADNLSILKVAFPFKEYAGVERLVQLHEEIVKSVAAIPGVVAATPVLLQPFSGVGGWDVHLLAEGRPASSIEPLYNVEVAGPDYFKTFEVPIRQGRSFTGTDREGSVPVVIVSHAVARQLWQDEDPIGKRLTMLGGPGVAALPGWWTVVGVAGETRYRDLRYQVPTVYFPHAQYIAFGNFAVRTQGDPSAVLPAVRQVMRDVWPGLALLQAAPMSDFLDEPLSQPRMSAVLLGIFGGAALLLAGIGLYGTLALSVSQRTRELGIRLALGATVRQLRWLVVAETLAVAGAGTFVGLCAALAGLRVLKTLVYEISPTDPVALAGVCGILAAVAALAAYLPARRATGVDPVHALRED